MKIDYLQVTVHPEGQLSSGDRLMTVKVVVNGNQEYTSQHILGFDDFAADFDRCMQTAIIVVRDLITEDLLKPDRGER